MRSSTFAIALLATSAVASPIKIVTDLVYVTQTYVLGSGPNNNNHHHHTRTAHKSISTVTPDVQQPAPTVVEQAPPPPEQTVEVPAPDPVPSPESSPVSSPESAPAPAPAYAPSGDYSTNCVNSHNVHRSNHSVGAVSWDAGLASIAAQIASSCNFAHDTTTGGGGYGQNIAAGISAENVAQAISNEWYNKEVGLFTQYGVADPDMSTFEGWGHFSQMVWKDTSVIGCATQSCPGGITGVPSNTGPYFTVCNYKNTGNVKGYFDKNVLPSLNQPTVTG